MESRSTLFFLVMVMTLGGCGKGDPVSSRQPAADSRTVAKRVSSSVTVSAPTAGQAESRMSGADTPGTDSTGVIAANSDTPGKDGDPGKPGTLVFTESADAAEELGADRFQLSAASISGDTLAVTVSYSGGCENHQVTLVASTSFLESDPVQLEVALAHNANGDLCRGWLTEDHYFSLVPIKKLFQSQYQNSGRIVLLLEDAPDELLYEFAE